MRIACYIGCAEIFNQVRGVLSTAGFDCYRFESELALLRALRREDFDLILAETKSDLAEKKTFYSWLSCRTHTGVPVVLLSPSPDARSTAFALNAGADDFIDRMCDPRILIARLNVVLRGSRQTAPTRVITLRDFTLDKNTLQVLDHGAPVDLTPREFALAWMFFISPGKFLSHQMISAAIWAVGDHIARHSIEQHVYQLRKKLNLSARRGLQIRNIYTKGYCLELCDEVAMQA